MSRIQKLETIYKEPLKEKDIKDTSNFIQYILDADITKGKYARFLIEAFLNDNFLEEDLIGGLESAVGQSISLFHKHKSKLPVHERSVYALNPETKLPLYQSPGDLWNSVKQYQSELSSKELKRDEQSKIYAETDFIYKDEETGFQIVSPLTKESAKWWGKGTRWCTSAENNNQFYSYVKDAPLFILLMPDDIINNDENGSKLQLWKNGNDIQFMDEADNRVTLDYIIDNHYILKFLSDFIPDFFLEKAKIKRNMTKKEIIEYIDSMHNRHPESLFTIDYNFLNMDQELWNYATSKQPNIIEVVPTFYRTEKMYLDAINFINKNIDNYKNTFAFMFIKNCKNKTVINYFINNTNIQDSFLSIPEEYITEKMCYLACENKKNIAYIPDKFIDEKFVLYILDNVDKIKQTLLPSFLKPKYLLNPLILKKSLEKGVSLNYLNNICKIPLNFEEYVFALKSDISQILFIPEKYQGRKLFQMACKINGFALDYIPQEFITLKMVKDAINQNGLSLQYVPEKYRTKEICALDIKQNAYAWNYIPDDIKLENWDHFQKIGSKSVDFIEFVEDKYIEDKKTYYLEVIKNDINNIRYVPFIYQDKSILIEKFNDLVTRELLNYVNPIYLNEIWTTYTNNNHETKRDEMRQIILNNFKPKLNF